MSFLARGVAEIDLSKERFSSVQLLSGVRLFATPWTAACQASLSIPNSRSLLKLMSIESVMPSNHLILCRPLLLEASKWNPILKWTESQKHPKAATVSHGHSSFSGQPPLHLLSKPCGSPFQESLKGNFCWPHVRKKNQSDKRPKIEF